MEKKAKGEIKTTSPILVAYIVDDGKIADLNRDIDVLYRYLYNNNLQDKIVGPTIALFYTEFGGKYVAAVPIKEKIPLAGSIKVGILPSVKCISAVRKGSWKMIEQSLDILKEYSRKHDLPWFFPVREIYIKTDGKESDYLTEIQMPIEMIKHPF